MKTLKEIRTSKGWTLSELARRARVHPADVGRIESGRMQPYAPQVARLSRALGIDRESFLKLVASAQSAAGGKQ